MTVASSPRLYERQMAMPSNIVANAISVPVKIYRTDRLALAASSGVRTQSNCPIKFFTRQRSRESFYQILARSVRESV